MRGWLFSSACLIVAVGLAACVTRYPDIPRKVSFAQDDFEGYAGEGTATISGLLRTKLRVGDPRLSAENVILLFPITPYILEHADREFVEQIKLWPALDPRAHHYMHMRLTDRRREFSFERLHAGEYSIGCFLEDRQPPVGLRSDAYGMLGGRWIFSPIAVSDGQNLQIILNEECLPEIQVAQLEPEVQAEPPQPVEPPKPAVTLAAKALFDSGQAELKPEGRALLKQLAESLKTLTDKEIRIEGHTDNVPIRGRLRNKYFSNFELSTARALNVMRFLVEEGGLAPENITAVGYADTRPVSSNETPEGRQENRRIEIMLLPKPASPPSESGPTGPSS